MVSLKAKVMVLLDTIQAAEMGGKEPSQSLEGTMVLPSWVPTSWQMLHAADSSTTRAKSSNELTSAVRNFLLMRPKQVSRENFVWPVIMKCGVVQTCEHSPHKVLHHGVILVLATAVISM